ncbi:MAG: hypothetical protein FWG85_03970, partial [Bacteroidetes bacterium]|nr:hypothetical protein [Bacteroidota bacterium]
MNNYIKLFKKVLKTASQRAMMLSQGVQKIKNATKDFYTYNNSSKTKSFKNVLMLASCIAMMLAIYTPQAEAQGNLIQIGDGTTTTTDGCGLYYLYGSSQKEYILTEAEITAAGGEPGIINSIAFQIGTVSNANWTQPGSYYIYMLNELGTVTTITSSHVPSAMELVYSVPTAFNPLTTLGVVANSWCTITLQTPFAYTGGSLYIKFCHSRPGYTSGSANIQFLCRSITGRAISQNTDSPLSGCLTTVTGTVSNLPNFRFEIESDDHDNLENTYKSAKVFQSDVTSVDRGDLDVPVLRLEVKTKGNLPPPQFIDTIKFSGKGSNIGNKINKAKLYYTGESATFNPNSAELLGTFDFASVSNTDTFKFVLPTPKSL